MKNREELRQSGKSTLLQNMSCVAHEQIQHRSPYRRSNCRGIIFAFGHGQNVAAGLIEAAGDLKEGEDFERALRRRIDEYAQAMQIPAVALVTNQAEPGDKRCSDFLSVAAVHAKSSGCIYLRDKVPNLGQIKPGRRVILIIPEERKQK